MSSMVFIIYDKHIQCFTDSNKMWSFVTGLVLGLASGHTSKFVKHHVMLLTHDVRGISADLAIYEGQL